MDTRFRVVVITLVGLLAAAVWALPYWWHILNPESVVAEGLPGLTLDERALYAALPNAMKAAYAALYTGDAEDEIPPQQSWALALVRARIHGQDISAAESADPFEPPPGSQIVATGEFADVDAVRQAQGAFTIYQNPDETRLLRIEPEFASSRAPGVHLILTRNPDPADVRGVGVDYIDIGELRGNVGAQQYILPASVNFDRYPVLVLYSPEHNGVLASATLQ